MMDTGSAKGVFDERPAVKEHPNDVVVDGHHDPEVGRPIGNDDSVSH